MRVEDRYTNFSGCSFSFLLQVTLLNKLEFKRSPETPSFEKGGLGRIFYKNFYKNPSQPPFFKGRSSRATFKF
jgi:hypothetical protein